MRKNFKTKTLALVMAATLATTAFAGCGNSSDSNEVESTSVGTENSNGDTSTSATTDLKVQVGSEPNSIDPSICSASDGMTLINQAFEALIVPNADGELVCGQASDYKVSDDGLVYTFTLRDDIFWSDGVAVTANDFVFSWQRLVDPATASDYNYMIEMVKNANAIMSEQMDKSELGIVAIDDKTLEITLEYPCSYFLEICAFPSSMPLREDVVTANPDTWAQSPDTYVSNGAFILTEWVNDSYMKYEPNPNYYGVDEIGPTSITFQLMDDDNAILSAFKTGELQFAASCPSEDIESMTDNGLYIESSIGTYFLVINVGDGEENEALKEADVRKALALAIDREYIVESVTKGGQIAADTFTPPEITSGDDFYSHIEKWWDNSTYEENCEEAKELLANSGYSGENITISYLYNTGSGHQAVAEAIQYMWEDVLGITVELDNQEWAVFQDTRDNGEYEVGRHGWLADYHDPLTFLNMWVTDGGQNNAFYANSEYDSLITTASTAEDQATNFEALAAAEAILAEDMPIIPIYYYTDLYLLDDSIQGFYTYMNHYYFKDVTIAE